MSLFWPRVPSTIRNLAMFMVRESMTRMNFTVGFNDNTQEKLFNFESSALWVGIKSKGPTLSYWWTQIMTFLLLLLFFKFFKDAIDLFPNLLSLVLKHVDATVEASFALLKCPKYSPSSYL